MVYLLSSMPYLDQYNKCYKNILTINVEPNGPLKAMVTPYKSTQIICFPRTELMLPQPNLLLCCEFFS